MMMQWYVDFFSPRNGEKKSSDAVIVHTTAVKKFI